MSTEIAKDTLKEPVDQLEGSLNDVENGDNSFPDRARIEKRLVRKLDMRFSILLIIYILNYIDRNNASTARTYGLTADLKLVGQQYPTLLSILYVGYILMQVPSNMLVQYLGRPSLYLPACVLIWGMISCVMGTTHNFTQALLCRFFLGFVEAAFFPGALFILSKWYTKKEYGLRSALLFCGSLISNAFGPLMAAGILGTMEGKLGIRAWRWLFYIEGALTMFFAVVAIFVLPNFPETTKRGFTEEELRLAELRMTEDVGEKDTSEGQSALQGFVAAVTDYKVWVMSLSLTAMVYFFPTLTATLGYSHIISLLLCAPPFAFASLCAFFVARHSDAKQERFLHIVCPLLMGIVGFVIAMASQATAARYVSFFLMAGSYSGFVVFYAWISTSFPRPVMKRAVAIAFINAFSQLGNVSGAYIFPSAWGPSYLKSYGICIACFGFCIMGCCFHRWTLVKLNRKLEQQDLQGGVADADAHNTALAMPRGFRYVL
ncbi:MFS general substrate transporter [Pseudohyphozyma bogoriensis]|nr:MFS general substrate transporter [Pseudohyphozyma bogoriensis]